MSQLPVTRLPPTSPAAAKPANGTPTAPPAKKRPTIDQFVDCYRPILAGLIADSKNMHGAEWARRYEANTLRIVEELRKAYKELTSEVQ